MKRNEPLEKIVSLGLQDPLHNLIQFACDLRSVTIIKSVFLKLS